MALRPRPHALLCDSRRSAASELTAHGLSLKAAVCVLIAASVGPAAVAGRAVPHAAPPSIRVKTMEPVPPTNRTANERVLRFCQG